MRGKPAATVKEKLQRGITPAGAGKTRQPKQLRFYRQDHPRRCGENSIPRRGHSVRLGSPPQVRGKRLWLQPPATVLRITPAGAGKTIGGNCGACAGQDHPRRCGENVFLNFCLDLDAGITPAGAGKTLICRPKPAKPWDHPRRCGENPIIRVPIAQRQGSPPQVRGKRRCQPPPSRLRRITPAGAGKTL